MSYNRLRLVQQRAWREGVTAVITALFAVPLALGLFVAAVVARGLVLTVLWGWFAVPVFGLPALGVASAIGLSVLLVYTLNCAKTKGSLGDVFLQALSALGAGWVIHLFL